MRCYAAFPGSTVTTVDALLRPRKQRGASQALFVRSRRRLSITAAVCLGSWAIFVKPLLRKNLVRARCHSGVGWTSSSRGFSRLSSVDIFSHLEEGSRGPAWWRRIGRAPGGTGRLAFTELATTPSAAFHHALCGPLRGVHFLDRLEQKRGPPVPATGTLLACSRLPRQVALLKATAQCEWRRHDGEPRVQADRGSLIAGQY